MNTTHIYCVNTSTFHAIPTGASLHTILDLLQVELPFPCVGAKVNNKAEGLNFKVFQPKDIEFIDNSSLSGTRIYIRSLCFVLAMAVNELFPDRRLRIEHYISHGYFCQLDHFSTLEQEQVAQIKAKMQELIDQNLPFTHHEQHTKEVAQLFRQKKMFDKVDLLETSGELYSSYYQINSYYDYYYGALLPTTGMLTCFDLQPYEQGMLLVAPSYRHPQTLPEVCEQPKLLQILKEFKQFNHIARLSNVGRMNHLIQEKKQATMMLVSEALQEKKIAGIADAIAARQDVRMILISGPSSSGKTTFAKKLGIQLMTNMIQPVTISLDNYFVERNNTPRDEHGDYDFESFYALDLELFNRHLQQLIAGEEISLPTYNFHTGKREYRGQKLQLGPNHLLVMEGIHALNPDLTPEIEEKLKYKIYVSALTTIALDDHNWIPTSDNRLIRRLVRDAQFRGYSALETIQRWGSVRAGEEKWVFPYQELADAFFNSAMLYELSVLKTLAEPLLRQVEKTAPAYAEAYRLNRFLSYFKPILPHDIPTTSLLREFLGGSTFEE